MSITAGPIGMTPHGQYSPTKQYPFLGIVSDNGSSYMYQALTPAAGKPLPVEPETETAYWMLVAKKGTEVELRVTDTAVEWQLAGTDTWTKIIDISVMTAARDEAVLAKNAAATSASEALASKTTAANSSSEALISKVAAQESAGLADEIRIQTENIRDEARAKVDSIVGMTAVAITLSSSDQATVDVKMEGGYLKLTIGVPQGPQGTQGIQGPTGNGIQSFLRTSGSGTPGTTDTYTLTFDNGATSTIQVYQGRDGLGAGDMHTDIYDSDKDGTVNRADIANSLSESSTIKASQVDGLSEYAKIIVSETEPTESGPLLWFQIKSPLDVDAVFELFSTDDDTEFQAEYNDMTDNIENLTSSDDTTDPDDIVVHYGDSLS